MKKQVLKHPVKTFKKSKLFGDEGRKHPVRRTFEIMGGVLLILLGIAGLFLPFLQGFLFIGMGIFLISPQHGKKLFTKAKKFWEIIKKKYLKK